MVKVYSTRDFGDGFANQSELADGVVWERDYDVTPQENEKPKRKKHYELYVPKLNNKPISGGQDITF